ncbi:nuclear pore membrane glycoprotein [Corchorus capsularis]|uniref:Nuclear pore membrane glycoprotein n=1 Tax=Corchorus capsularis TaxID=210143 RepID=A0A1R3GAV6_COCAP|nr:nuclear pore membrane glycoprotein [Corchorus capsularis]
MFVGSAGFRPANQFGEAEALRNVVNGGSGEKGGTGNKARKSFCYLALGNSTYFNSGFVGIINVTYAGPQRKFYPSSFSDIPVSSQVPQTIAAPIDPSPPSSAVHSQHESSDTQGTVIPGSRHPRLTVPSS